MSTLPRRQSGLLVTAGLVLVGAVVAVALFITSGKASNVNLTSASLVPEDAAIYIGFNTDFASSQWVAAFGLIERMGQEDPFGQIKKSATEDGGVDWDKDVAPFLGGNAGLFLNSVDIKGRSATGALILRCTDPARALSVIVEQSGVDFETLEHDGISYRASDELYLARIGDHLVVAPDQDSLFSVIAVSKGEKKPLAEVADFRDLRDELTGNFLAFLYFDADRVLSSAFVDDPAITDALRSNGAMLKPSAMVLGAKDGGFQFQSASRAGADSSSPMLAPRKSRFASMVPADTAVFFSTSGIAAAWDEDIAKSRADLDDAARSTGKYASFDDALTSIGKESGLNSLEEVIHLLTGETAVAAWSPEGDVSSFEGLLLIEVKDEAVAKDVLTRIANGSDTGSPSKRMVGNTEMTVWVKGGGENAFAVRDGYLLVGTVPGVQTVLEGKQPPLTDLKGYRDTVKAMPSALGTYAYLDLYRLLHMTKSGVPAELDEAAEALEGAIFNMVTESGFTRISGVLTVTK